MTGKALIPLFGLLALAGCGSPARDEANEAGMTIAADPNATMAKAAKDVEAAGDQAIGGTEGNAASDIGDAANEIQD
ncbi:MAG: hypothetical protein WC816_11045 [Sphingomonas sp.]|jgi:hypothetical protein